MNNRKFSRNGSHPQVQVTQSLGLGRKNVSGKFNCEAEYMHVLHSLPGLVAQLRMASNDIGGKNGRKETLPQSYVNVIYLCRVKTCQRSETCDEYYD